MKYLLLLLTLPLFGSPIDTLPRDKQPSIVKDGTVYVPNEVWVEPIDSEIKQRHTINVLSKKLVKTRAILKKKKGLEHELDSLLQETMNLQNKRDSLVEVINTEIDKNSEELISSIHKLQNRVDFLYKKYQQVYESRRKIRKKLFVSIAGNVILAVIIVAII